MMSNIILFEDGIDSERRENNEDDLKPYRIAIIGDPNVGKTCLVVRWIKGESALHQAVETELHVEDMYKKEIEYDAMEVSKTCKEYHSIVAGDINFDGTDLHSRNHDELGEDHEATAGRRVSAQVMDITDLDVTAYSEIRNLQLAQADGFVLCYSLTDPESLENLILYQRMITRLKGDFVPIIVCGNKSDHLVERKISQEMAMNFCEEMGIDYSAHHFETSAMENDNVNEAFYTLLKLIQEERENPGLRQKQTKNMQNETNDELQNYLRDTVSNPATVVLGRGSPKIAGFADDIVPIASSNIGDQISTTETNRETSSRKSKVEHGSRTFEMRSLTPNHEKNGSSKTKQKKHTPCCIIS